MNKLIALVGMCGSGKSEVGVMLEERGYTKIHFGSITTEEVKKRGLELNEKNERFVREQLRKEYGMAAYAILNIPKIESALKTSNVLIDGLYSWSEYKILKEKFADRLTVVSVFSSPKTRYNRLSKRTVRSLTAEEAKSRDYSEIENLEKGGPIAIADFTIINESSIAELKKQAEMIFK